MKKLFKLAFMTMIGLTVAVIHANAAQVTFNPELVLSEEYSDNWRQDSDGDTKIDDFVTTAGLLLNLSVLGKTAGMTLNYNPSYSIFADNDDFDYWRHFVEFSVWNAFSRNTRLEFTSNFLDTEDPLDSTEDTEGLGAGDTPGIDIDPTRRGRGRYRINNNRLRLSHQFGLRDNVYAQVDFNTLEDRDVVPPNPVGNYDEVRPAIGFESWYEQNWGASLDYFYSDRSYDVRADREEHDGTLRFLKRFNRQFVGYLQYRQTVLNYKEPATEIDFEVYSPAIGFEYVLRENIAITLGAGYYFQEFDSAVIDEVEALYLDSEISAEWALRTGFVRLTASSGYDIADTGAADLGLQIYYQTRLEVAHNFSSKVSGEVFVGYRYDDYPNETPDRSDQAVTAGTGLNYQALRWLNLGLDYNYTQVFSDSMTEEYTENTVLFTITISPVRPFRLN